MKRADISANYFTLLCITNDKVYSSASKCLFVITD